MRRGLISTILLLVMGSTIGLPAVAKVLVMQEQAVKEAFPGASVVKRTDYLTEEQAGKIAALAGTPPSSRIVLSWRATKDDHPLGTAYIETHVVRTLPETILVVVDPRGHVGKVEILSFDEPDEYLPRPRWLDQFKGRALDPELSLRTGIRGITGATLSSRAIASAVRRVLAAHAVLGEARGASSSQPSPAPTPPSSSPSPAPAPSSPAPPPSSRQGTPPPSPPPDARP